MTPRFFPSANARGLETKMLPESKPTTISESARSLRFICLGGIAFFVAGAVAWVSCGIAIAEPPPKLTEAEAQQRIEDGDRLADQSDYLQAVEKYTEAYLSIVTQIRGQEFITNVKPTLMTRSELSEEMKRQFEIDYTDGEVALMEGTYKVFGLVPKNLDVRSTIIKLLTEEVGGFYDPRTKAMVLIREDGDKKPGFIGRLFGQKPAFDKDEQKVTLAHELTHALQDQLYGLKQLQESIEKDDDMGLAFSALVEGDATLIMFGEMGRQEGNVQQMTEMTPEAAEMMFSFMQMMLPMAGGKTYRNAPPIFREGLLFPYAQGLVFHLNMTREKGISSLDQSYLRPPVSTEQILHPEKYFREIDEPITVTIPDAEKLLGDSWKHLGGNCMGEFQIGILFKGISGAAKAAAGWDGDRYEVYQNAEGQLAMVWYTTWDSAEDANQFEAAYMQAWQKRMNQEKEARVKASLPEEAEVPMSLRQLPDREHPSVLIVQGVDASLHDGLLKKLEQRMLAPKKFPGKAKRLDE